MSNGKPKPKGSAEGSTLSPVELFVWACFAVALLASLYFLLREPEDDALRFVRGRMAQARLLALAASVVGTVPGLWHILSGQGDRHLVAMAALFNLMLAAYWLLRVTLT